MAGRGRRSHRFDRGAVQNGDGWVITDIDLRSTEADMQLECDHCGWTKTIAAGEWEAR